MSSLYTKSPSHNYMKTNNPRSHHLDESFNKYSEPKTPVKPAHILKITKGSVSPKLKPSKTVHVNINGLDFENISKAHSISKQLNNSSKQRRSNNDLSTALSPEQRALNLALFEVNFNIESSHLTPSI